MSIASQPPDFLAHDVGDSVAVAVRDLEPGPVSGGYLTDEKSESLTLSDAVPLGHKLALVDIPGGADVLEYGIRIGIATQDIARGSYVHVHNLRSARWQNSRA